MSLYTSQPETSIRTVYGSPVWSEVMLGDRIYERALVRTPWLTEQDDLPTVIHEALNEVLRSADTVFVSEKVAVLLTGHAVPASRVRVGRLARLVAAGVKPIGKSRGLSIPEKVQYVMDEVGVLRVLAAALATAVTRPLGLHGAFYRIAGSLARDLDGMRPPYEGLLLPPFSAEEGAQLADRLADTLGAGVAIVDINDRGGSVRATSRTALPDDVVFAVLRDNPLGQRDQSTPVGLVRAT